MLNLYRFKCTTEDIYIFIISDSAPTECPNDSGHTIDTTSMSIIESDVNNINGHDCCSLAIQKEARCLDVDNKSAELIEEGYLYDSQIMSASINHQCNIESMFIERSTLSYPVNYMNKSNTNYVTLSNATDIENIYHAGKTFKMDILVDGASLKVQINNASNQTELDAVVDNRVIGDYR